MVENLALQNSAKVKDAKFLAIVKTLQKKQLIVRWALGQAGLPVTKPVGMLCNNVPEKLKNDLKTAVDPVEQELSNEYVDYH